jgi:DNA-directed RNA polymerase subunit N (RpoN/RPB10)
MSIHWINHGLPCRPTNRAEAYGIFSKTAGEMPPLQDREIERFSQFKNAHDLADAQEKGELPALGPNPVGMEWVYSIRGMMISCAPNLIMHDWAFDLSWSEANGKVFCCGMVVGESLPEFLARLRVESDIWTRLLDAGIQDYCQAQTRNPLAIARMWQKLPETMPPRLIEYLDHLRAARMPPSAANRGNPEDDVSVQ